VAITNSRWLQVSSMVILLAVQSLAASQKSGSTSSEERPWSIQVAQVDSVDVNLDPVFRVAIYENLMAELSKSRAFKAVYRSGDRSADGEKDLLILKVTVRKFQAGSETKRAVTTVAGATKITADFRLETNAGQSVKEDVVHGNVRFVGSNMKATRNLAHGVATKIKASKLPELPATGMALVKPTDILH